MIATEQQAVLLTIGDDLKHVQVLESCRSTPSSGQQRVAPIANPA